MATPAHSSRQDITLIFIGLAATSLNVIFLHDFLSSQKKLEARVAAKNKYDWYIKTIYYFNVLCVVLYVVSAALIAGANAKNKIVSTSTPSSKIHHRRHK
jgi:uridylate kinase